MSFFRSSTILFLSLLIFSSCQAARGGRILSLGGSRPHGAWTEEERGRVLAIQTLRQTREASFHLVRIRGAEKPHVHDRHDLVVFILKGKALIHLGDETGEVGPADVIEIPRGTLHWAETVGGRTAEAYIVFTPPFDGKDHREAG